MVQKALVVIVAIFSGCGGTHLIGTEREEVLNCAAHAECPGGACDEGVCRTACGSNHPGSTCASDETCDGWICRQVCTSGEACPAGTACDEAAGSVCRPPRCGATVACPLRNACANGTCVPVGQACDPQRPCADSSLRCVNGFCALPCGPNAPNNFCQTGAQCLNEAFCAN